MNIVFMLDHKPLWTEHHTEATEAVLRLRTWLKVKEAWDMPPNEQVILTGTIDIPLFLHLFFLEMHDIFIVWKGINYNDIYATRAPRLQHGTTKPRCLFT